MVARLWRTLQTTEGSDAANVRRRASRRVGETQAIGMRTHLYPPFATCQTARLCAPLDLFLVAAAGQDALVGLGRQLVAHRIELRGAHVAHVHLLARLRMAWVRIILRHAVLRWWQR